MSDRIKLIHGAGGSDARDLIRSVFLRKLTEGTVPVEEDAALIADDRLAITTDGFVMDPPSLPGVDIGKLAVCGTVNDLAVRGASARWLTAAWVIPEGFPVAVLSGFVQSMSESAAEAGAQVVAGDTKVLPWADLRGPVVVTTGVGVVESASSIAAVRPGDVLIVTDGIGEHEAALIAAREGLMFDDLPPSDCRLLSEVAVLAFAGGACFARDLTRGGLEAVLHEIADAGSYRLTIRFDAVPVRGGIMKMSELLGVSPLSLASEGCALVAAAPDRADALVDRLRAHPYGRLAAVIGEVGLGEVGVELFRDGKMMVLDQGARTIPRIC